MKIAINGFGRVGRAAFRICIERGIKIVAINDLHGVNDAEYLLKYDSVYGRYDKKVEIRGNDLVVGGKLIKVFSERDPILLPWRKLGVDIVIESTGVFRERELAAAHLQAGAKRVLITAPAKGMDLTILPGVNHKSLKKNHKIISVASCTTNALAPLMDVLRSKFGVKKGFVTTIHAYTGNQSLVDSSHKKRRRGRAAAVNMIPTSTGATNTVCEVIPGLTGKITGVAIRVPVITGSLIDLVVELYKEISVKDVNKEFKRVTGGRMKGIIDYTEDEIVSSDIIGNSHSVMVDGLSTQGNGNIIKIMAWYDNEWGYSNRVVDVIEMLKRFC